MTCTFKLFNGEHQESNSDPVKTWTIPCNTDERTSNGNFGTPENLFQYFYNQRANIRSLQNPFGRYYLNMDDVNLDGIY